MKFLYLFLFSICFFSCKNADRSNVFWADQDKSHLDIYPLGQRKMEIYFLGEKNVIMNYHYYKLWDSHLFHYDFDKGKKEKIPIKNSYVYDVDVFDLENQQKIVLVYSSSHMGNGGCYLYVFDDISKSLTFKVEIKGTKSTQGAFSHKLTAHYEDANGDGVKDLIFKGYGYVNSAKYPISRCVLLNSNFGVEKDITSLAKRDYLTAIFSQLYPKVQTTSLYVMMEALIKILNDLDDSDLEYINKYSSVNHEIVKLLLSRFNGKIETKNKSLIHDLIENKETMHYDFLYEVLRVESLKTSLSEIEKKFIERYEVYLSGNLNPEEI